MSVPRRHTAAAGDEELLVAANYLQALVDEREEPPAPIQSARFAAAVKAGLRARIDASWHPANPEQGSARRAVVWDAYADDGTGLDELLLAACVHLHGDAPRSDTAAHAKYSLPLSFTLWIDPGCVAASVQAFGRTLRHTWVSAIPPQPPDASVTPTTLWSAPRAAPVLTRARSTLPRVVKYDAPPPTADADAAADSSVPSGKPVHATLGPALPVTGEADATATIPRAPTVLVHDTQGQEPESARPASLRNASATGTWEKLTTHDNGNVGVLSGGIKLGSSPSASASTTRSRRPSDYGDERYSRRARTLSPARKDVNGLSVSSAADGTPGLPALTTALHSDVTGGLGASLSVGVPPSPISPISPLSSASSASSFLFPPDARLSVPSDASASPSEGGMHSPTPSPPVAEHGRPSH